MRGLHFDVLRKRGAVFTVWKVGRFGPSSLGEGWGGRVIYK